MKARKVLSLFLALTLCLGVLSPMAAAAENSDTLTSSNGNTITIRGYTRKIMETYLYYSEENGTTEEEFLVYYVPDEGATITISGRPQWTDFYGEISFGMLQDYDISDKGIYPWYSEGLGEGPYYPGRNTFTEYWLVPDVHFLIRCESDTRTYPCVSWREAPAAVPAPELGPTIVSTGVLPEKSGTAHQNTQNISVDGKAVKFDTYALANANGGLTNYVKLRDLADILDGTAAQFNVDWTKERGVFIETDKPYTTRNGQEGKTPYTGNRAYVKGEPTTLVDGVALELQAFVLTDDNGGNSTYYQLRDLGQALGFNVGWTQERGVFIETDKPYDPNN